MIRDGWRRLRRGVDAALGSAPLADGPGLARYLASRAAQVSQSALYGYLRTRMGTRYPKLFEDPAFEPEIARARDVAFRACLADLTVYAVALIARGRGAPGSGWGEAAIALYDAALALGLPGAPADAAFADRARATDWDMARDPALAFATSPSAVIDAAPVIDAFREEDREIVEASLRYRWIDVRRQLDARLDPDAVARDLGAPD